MGKKILILAASPRRGGNSDLLCDQFKRGAEAAGHEVSIVFLREKKIGYCRACDACRRTGSCVQQDDMAALLDAMEAAQVIVLATPVYFYAVSAQIKTVIDRTVARYTKLSGKELYYILTAADTNQDMLARSAEAFRGFAACLPGSEEKGVVYGGGAWQAGDIKASPAMQKAYDLGSRA